MLYLEGNELQILLELCTRFHLKRLHDKIDFALLVFRYQQENLPDPFSDLFLNELGFVTEYSLKECQMVLQNHFNQKLTSLAEDFSRDQEHFAKCLIDLFDFSEDFIKVIWEPAPLLKKQPTLLGALWNEASKVNNQKMQGAILKFCQKTEYYYISLENWDVPPQLDEQELMEII